MATNTQAQLNNIKTKLASAKRGTPEYKTLLERFNKLREQEGREALTAKQAQTKAQTFAAKQNPAPATPAPVSSAPPAYQSSPYEMDLGKKTENLINAQKEAADHAAKENFDLATPGTQENEYGTRTTTRDPVTGEVKVTDTMSEDQKRISDQGEDLTITGQGKAQSTLDQFSAGFNPETIARTNTGDLAANRARIEEEVFGRLTRGLDEQKGNERQQLEQTLRNRGIPLGSKQFNDQMAQFDKRYDTRTADARAQATEMGGNEYSRDFGINEQTIANQISQGQSIRNQNLGEAQALQGMGAGQADPKYSDYQPTQYETPDVVGAYNSVTSANQGKTALQIEQERLKAEQARINNSGGGSGGGSTTTTKSPFNNTPAS